MTTPRVQGIMCPSEHFNNPAAPYCGVCGIALGLEGSRLVRRPRPPLGVLVLDDGSDHVVDIDLVIGRRPGAHPLVKSGKARGVIVSHPSVAAAHLHVTIDGWRVLVHDLTDAEVEAVELHGGTRLAVGDRTLVFEAL